jgi:hypothetical protein
VKLLSLPVSLYQILRSLYRVRALDTRRETIQVVRWQTDKPARMANRTRFFLFYRPQVFKAFLFSAFLFAVVVWTIKNYIELIQLL